jgi:hypothetical protein
MSADAGGGLPSSKLPSDSSGKLFANETWSVCLKRRSPRLSNSAKTRKRASVLVLSRVFALCFAPLVSALPTDPIRTGDYEDANGAGSYLEISTADHGKLSFVLLSNGANGHSCFLSGTIEGNRGQSGTEHGLPNCAVDFHQTSNAIDVQVSGLDGNFEACRSYCGMRAGLEVTFTAPPAGCSRLERQATYRIFAQSDKDHEYGRAFEELRRVQAHCPPFLGWKERDAVHNHLALRLHHLGKNDECLRELENTLGSSAGDEETLRDSFYGEPMHFDYYLPTAKTTWYIRKLCKGEEPKVP